jgi:hypothetical protein
LEKHLKGPDWTDVATMMSAMETLHGCRVGLTVIAGSQGHNGCLDIVLSAVFPVLPGSAELSVAEAKSEWPCKECKTLAAHIFGGLYRLDFAISERYKQEVLPGV